MNEPTPKWDPMGVDPWPLGLGSMERKGVVPSQPTSQQETWAYDIPGKRVL